MTERFGEVEDEQLLSPRRAAAARLLKSPVSASAAVQQNALHFLGSNDDQLERAQARAARAAAIRRKPIVAVTHGIDTHPRSDVLGKEQITELFHNCIKLASENKINQKNTWELNLIDHLSEIIKVESDDDAETNFQKASCTLEAGVKIYSLRVDSVHSEAYKVLGGINRAGRDDDKENIPEVDSMGISQEGIQKKGTDRKVSPLSTLESSFDVLNVKKFDAAFTVDPLYHQTSAKFDEGGAKGLLLNNLGVYGDCQVLFDSLESPTNVTCSKSQADKSDFIDLSFARDCIGQMMTSIAMQRDISPTLREIISLFNEDNRRPTDIYVATQRSDRRDDMGESNKHDFESNENEVEGNEKGFESNENGFEINKNEFESNTFDDCEPCGFDNDEQGSVVDDCSSYTTAHFAGDPEENSSCTLLEQDADPKFESIAGFLALGLGFAPKTNAWAGPDHWKYRKIKEESKKKKQEACDIDFTKALDKEISDIFAPPKSRRSILLPPNRGSCSITLPEDCHYQAQNLVRLLLRPDVLCLGKKLRKSADESSQRSQPYELATSWDNESVANDYYDDENMLNDFGEPGSLVSQPRQVNKIEVRYDKSSKQVDVHALKDTLWCIIKDSKRPAETRVEDAVAVSFRQVLGCFSENCSGAYAKDVSPHLSFICLLHLANEHSLTIRGTPSLDELEISLPPTKTSASAAAAG
ncbi:unnamed protein product [Spirodela intermedia]|uniref:Condensin complex subunit 2 n=1 Tax=Spirodela intermedia TaxID=51605 RepID=A0A7I8JM96_SPIIN|nr:unnamed protein product [Spirodela intermedia]CAA6671288.1 unnamed protein product [Spirodela intermedia]